MPIGNSSASEHPLPPAPSPPREGGAGGKAHPVPPWVLYVNSTGSQGGIERYSLRLAERLRARGVPLLYACRPGAFVEARCRESGIPTAPLRIRNSGDLAASWRLARLIVARKIALVHVHSRRDYVPAVLGVALARLWPGVRPRLILHAHLIRPLGTPARLNGWFFTRSADAVIGVSQAVRDSLTREHGFPPSFVRLIHNGVNVSEYAAPGTSQSTAWRGRLRAQWGIPADAPVIGMVGRLNAKGQEALLKVAPTLVRRFPALRLVLVGPEGQEGDRRRLTDEARAAGIAGQVIFTGPRDDVPAVMAAFDVLAHLPTDESFGLALVEAMAAGLPTVATEIGGCREVVQGGVTGLLVAPGDSEALASALSGLLSDPHERARLGAAGRQAAEAQFSLERQMDRLQALYAELCPAPRA